MTSSSDLPAPRPTPGPRPSRRLPWRFRLWALGAVVSSAGDAVLAFAVIWLASGHGAAAVALTSTLALLPRVLLMLLGGVLGDRHGPRRLLVVTHVLQIALLLGLSGLVGPSPTVGVLVVTALATGLLTALGQPAALVLPRLLLDRDDQLPRALAQISGGIQLARILGVPLGGALVSAHPLTLVLALDAATVALALTVLLALRPRPARAAEEGRARRSILHDLVDGFRTARQLRLERLLASVALLCAAVLPSVAVLVPITARDRGWTAMQTARMDAAWAAGVLVVTVVVSLAGALGRTRLALAGGCGVCALALVLVAATPSPLVAAASTVLLGCGTALFTTHVAPTLIRLAPPDQLSRFQSLLGLVQLLPPAVLNAPYAGLGQLHPPAALGAAALLALLAAAPPLCRGPQRGTTAP